MEWPRSPAPREIWAERLRRYVDSGLTVAAFCRRERVSVPMFYYWRRKLPTLAGTSGSSPGRRSGSARAPQKQDFVPIAIRSSAAIRLRLPNGAQVWLPAGDAGLLSAAIAAAGSLASSLPEEDAC
jgi:hypothetical protein